MLFLCNSLSIKSILSFVVVLFYRFSFFLYYTEAEVMPAKSIEKAQFEMIEELYNNSKHSKSLSRIYGWGGILVTVIVSIITYLLSKC